MNQQYDLELDKIRDLVQKKLYTKILIQMPEGMLDLPLKMVFEELNSLDIEFIVSGDPSYGVCDIGIDLAIRLECDLLLHFGHTEFGFADTITSRGVKKLDIMLVPSSIPYNIPKFSKQLLHELDSLKWFNIGLSSTAQHLNLIKDLKVFLSSKGFNLILKRDGQILGCKLGNIRYDSDNIDGIISLHAGNFHTYGLMLSTAIPILQLDPYSGKIMIFREKDRNRLIQKRYSIIHKARDANFWGVLSSTKIGQYHPNQIEQAEKILVKHNKPKIRVIAENLSHKSLNNINWIEAWVVTACPRLIDDQVGYSVPILNFKEFLYLFNEMSWDDLLKNGFF